MRKLCKYTDCKNFDRRVDSDGRVKKRSCYHEPFCWRGYVDIWMEIRKSRRKL